MVVVVLLVALCLLHHDFWWWGETRPLVLGFLPIGLAWHVGLSFATAIIWWLATAYCWPQGLEEEHSERDSDSEYENDDDEDDRDDDGVGGAAL